MNLGPIDNPISRCSDLKSELEAVKAVLAQVVAAVVLNPMTDDDDKIEIQRRWATLNTNAAAAANTED